MKYRLMEHVTKNEDDLRLLAEALNISYQTLSKKLNGHTDFWLGEIKIIKARYNLTLEELDYIFYSS